jgi:hypothetical protein
MPAPSASSAREGRGRSATGIAEETVESGPAQRACSAALAGEMVVSFPRRPGVAPQQAARARRRSGPSGTPHGAAQ